LLFIDKVAFLSDIPEACEGREKNFRFKSHVYSSLKIKLKKHQKKGLKKLEYLNKGTTFAPATTQTFFNRLASNTN
jgi:hypothetical protein